MINAESWTKSSYSEGAEGSCVEFMTSGTAHVAVQDSKVDNGPQLKVSRGALASFLAASAAGTFGGPMA